MHNQTHVPRVFTVERLDLLRSLGVLAVVQPLEDSSILLQGAVSASRYLLAGRHEYVHAVIWRQRVGLFAMGRLLVVVVTTTSAAA